MAAAEELPEVSGRLAALTLVDEHRLSRRLQRAQRLRDPAERRAALTELEPALAAAERRTQARRRVRPEVSYPPQLPVSDRVDDLRDAIEQHQVVVVAGETGSGKTTQLPKVCLELGRGVRGMIGHTQPRRLAARTVADRIAEELGVPLGGEGSPVGWQVRFHDDVSDTTLVKVMTDGILLAEIASDPDLRAYDTVILDEAHERSLTVDFLLGYLARLLPRRPDLHLVITSATIDPQRFADHFATVLGTEVPVVEVSGRTYPVEVRYRPYGLDPGDDRDGVQAVLDAVDELAVDGPGDVLVFCSGEREIRDVADALRGPLGDSRRAGPPVEVLPLYARLSVAEQHRVFAPHAGRRVVVATNVAETSLTVPGIRYVVDLGTARISRYSSRLKVQRLPVEPVSQASADQRAGRCGRVAEGVAIRLYAEEDYLARPRFTDPEILRTNLASVLLQMADLGLGDVAGFPFLDPPDRRAVRDGTDLLRELGALDARGRLTPVGRRLAALPVDPRIARMVLEADPNGCVAEVLVIAAALSVPDPRERPAEQQQAADEMHRRFADPTSDFVAYLDLWRYLQERRRELGSSAFRRLCKREFLSVVRVREWQEVHAQLRSATRGLGIRLSSAPADPVRLHTSLLAGLLSHVGLQDPERRDYLGARGARFALWPGSALARKPPAWVVAAELVETSRLWGRTAARIDPSWVEPLAQHLVKRQHSEPHWSRRSAAAMAYERVTLYGVPIVTRRRVPYARVDPEAARDVFLRSALVEGDWETHHRFLADNRGLLEDAAELEDRVRRRGLVIGEDALLAFYDARVPPDVVSGRHFDSWWKREQHRSPDLLTLTPELLLDPDAPRLGPDDFPDVWPHAVPLALTYAFDPGSDVDGVTAHVPLPLLDAAADAGLDWQVPGRRLELVTELIRSLPKALRRSFVPAPDTARAVLAELVPYERPLVDALAAALTRRAGVLVDPADLDPDALPPPLQVRVAVEDDAGRVLAAGRDLADLRRRLAPRLQRELSAAADDLERDRVAGADLGELPRTVDRVSAGHRVVGFPALVDDGGSGVGIRVLRTPREQDRAMRRGTRALLLRELPSPVRRAVDALDPATRLSLGSSPYPSVDALLADCAAAAVDALVEELGGPAWDATAYAALRDRVGAQLPARTERVVRDAAAVLDAWREVQDRLRRPATLTSLAALTDVREQVAALLPDGFVTAAGATRLPDLRRYLRAALRRLDALDTSPTAPARDRERAATVQQLVAAYGRARAVLPPERRQDADVESVRWLLEELRVSLFAQTLGTRVPVSPQRVQRALDALAA